MNRDNKQSSRQTNVTRRGFFGGAAIVLGTAAFATSAGMFTGCSKEQPTGSSSGINPDNVPYEVYEADLVIVGTGLTGAQAAIRAQEKDASVILVDKGPFQFGGAAGMNWDIMIGVTPEGTPYENEPNASGNYILANQELNRSLYEYHEYNLPAKFARDGATTCRRQENGEVFYLSQGKNYNRTDRGLMRYASDRVRYSGMLVYDQTMITDVIITDGTCRGVIGVHIPTGTIRVFRSKATVKASGPSSWLYGWSSVAAVTLNVPDNTGELDYAAYRHGCELLDNEFFKWDLITVYPEAIAASFNAGLGADVASYKTISNSEGTYFLKDIPQEEMNRNLFTQLCAQEIYEGRVGEQGGLFIDMDEETVARMRPVYRRNVELFSRVFGIDTLNGAIEVGMETYEHGGNPRVDMNLMTALPGLFDVRGGGTSGDESGISGMRAYRQAPYIVDKACEYIKDKEEIMDKEDIDMSSIQTEIQRLYGIKNNDMSDGLRPHTIRHAIQKACYEGLGPVRDAEKLTSCIAELERIEKEDLPRQVVSNKTQIYNTEWKEAIENHGLLALALAAAKASLMREESRGQMMRSDFPEKDDAYWGTVNIAAQLVDGKMQLTKTPVGEMPA